MSESRNRDGKHHSNLASEQIYCTLLTCHGGVIVVPLSIRKNINSKTNLSLLKGQ